LTGRAATATEPYPRVVVDAEGVAIGGYDPVAYFQEGRAVIGSAAHVHRWNGATWRFATAGARDRFAADPEAYAPRFGGWCAFAMSEDRLAPGDPRVWKIVAGRLYLNCSARAQRDWEADLEANIARGEAVWARRRPMLPAPE
jgi:hypothetical protein